MRRFLWGAGCVLTVLLLLVAGVLLSIRHGLQSFSDDATRLFPGDRVTALMQVVDCTDCPLKDRNHAIWALGQMAEARSLSVLKKYSDGHPCTHTTRPCQHELRKAIRNIESAKGRTGLAWRLVDRWRQPWN